MSRNSISRRTIGLLAIILAASCGCGDGPTTFEVSGTVTFDGKPVERGEISFVSVEPSGAPDGGVIADGKFSFRATVGKKLVRITGSRPLPADRQTSPEMGLLYEDFIPDIYNSQSELSFEVSPKGGNTRDFQLTSP